MRHMRYEWLKLSKSKLHIIVLMALLCLPTLIVMKGYDQTIESFNFPSLSSNYDNSLNGEIDYVIDAGTKYSGFDAIRLEDQISHNLSGFESDEWYAYRKQITDEKIANMQQEKALDDSRMTKSYGEHWEELYEKAKNQTLTHREFRNALGERFAGGAEVDLDSVIPFDQFPVYYEEAYEIELDSIVTLYSRYLNEDWKLFEKEEFLITKDKLLDLAEYNSQRVGPEKPSVSYPKIFMEVDVDSSDAEIEYLNQKYLNESLYQDGIGAYTFFIEIMDSLKWFLPTILILFGILFSGIFNIEYTHKTDQSLRAMKHGNATQAKAKLKLSFALFFGFSLFTILLALLLPQMMIGYHSLEVSGHYVWSISHEMIYMCASFLISMLFYYALLMVISVYTKSKFIALIVFVVLVLLTCYGGDMASMMNQDWLSLNSSLPGGYFVQPYDIELLSLFGIIFERCYLLMVLFFMSAIGLVYLAYQHYQKRDIENA